MNEIKDTIFVTKVRTDYGKSIVRKLIASIRTFGGNMSHLPVWVYVTDPPRVSCSDLAEDDVRIINLEVPPHIFNYILGDKVYACAKAEELSFKFIHSLIWIDPLCMVLNPPALFELKGDLDVAIRPVHIRNVGLGSKDPVNQYWKKVYETVGIEDTPVTVETFVEQQQIRAYFNTHAFAINPARGMLRLWLKYFDLLVRDETFQNSSYMDEDHQIFLHQAVLSALIALLPSRKVRILPPVYSYPYNLHSLVSPERQAKALNDLICVALEEPIGDPSEITDIQILEPLRGWLASYSSSGRRAPRKGSG